MRAIDSTSIWLSKLLMHDSEHDDDRAVLGQLEADLDYRSLDEAFDLIDVVGRKDAGAFGLDHAKFLLFPLVMPAVHEFVKLFVKMFVDSATAETGKMTAAALKTRVGNVLGNLEGQQLQHRALADLERCFAARAAEMNFPKRSYNDLLRQMRNNPLMFL